MRSRRPAFAFLLAWMFACPVAASLFAQTAEPESDRASHLLQAAEHLQAAGKADLAKQALLGAKLEQLRKLQAEVDQLRRDTASEQTVLLQVKLIELQTSKMRELGLDFQMANGANSSKVHGDAIIKLFDSGKAIDGFLAALRQHKLAKILAEPTLVTLSGRPASFHSGGEFPVVVPDGTDEVAVEYREFGTRIDFVPRLLANGRVRLELRSTVSEIDTSLAVTAEDTSVPALRTRSVDTAVEMLAGQTLVVGGCVQERKQQVDGADAPSKRLC